MLRRLLRSRESSVSREDLPEAERLSATHTAQARLLDPQLSAMIDRHLAAVHNTGRRSKVLDVGTGSGAWAIALADQQPFADVTAIDIDWSNFRPTNLRHGNVDFETFPLQDISRPLPYHRNSFDVIHVSGMLLEQPHCAALIERLAVTLHQGGLMVLVESEPRFLSEPGEMSRDVKTWDACVVEAFQSRNIDVNLPASLGAMVANTGLFMHPLITQEKYIYTAGTSRHSVSQLANRGLLHQDVVESSLRNMLPILEGYGYAPSDLHRLLASCVSEIGEGRGRCYQRLFIVCAYKNLHR